MKNVTKMLLMLLVVFSTAFVLVPKVHAQTLLLTESFENGGAIPANWVTEQVTGTTGAVTYLTTSLNPPGNVTPYNGSYMAVFNARAATSGNATRLRRSVSLNTTTYGFLSLNFALFHDVGNTALDSVSVVWSLDAVTWNRLPGAILRYDGTYGWKIHSFNLPSGTGLQANVYVGFQFTGRAGNDIHMDLVNIYGNLGGTLTGTVTDAATAAALVGVSVVVNGMTPVLTNASGVYIFTNVYPGTWPVTATFANYNNYTSTLNPVITAGNTTTKNFSMVHIPATLSGTITDAANGHTVEGAKVVCSTTPAVTTYTIANGTYSLPVYPFASAPYTVTVSKTGFSNLTLSSGALTQGVTTPLNGALLEAINTPSQPFVAAQLDTTVHLSWNLPVGDYELYYDDGGEESSTVWVDAGNMSAVHFTALNAPYSIKGGSVYIGPSTDYLEGTLTTALTAFKVQVYDATGTGGTPGAAVGNALTVTPTAFGWNTFTFATPVAMTNGDFYIVMIQGGANTTACRLGVDATSTQLRSFNKFVTGGGSWLPANGNFMIRSVVTGVGGPLDNTSSVTTYKLYRLQQGQEIAPGNVAPGTWLTNFANTTAGLTTKDTNWRSLAAGAYRWAVQAQYTAGTWSNFIYSNVLGKNWTAAVTVKVHPSCTATDLSKFTVTLTNSLYHVAPYNVDSVYTAITDITGQVVFPKVWKGTYTLAVTFGPGGYPANTQSVLINADKVITVNMVQEVLAPYGMAVNSASLLATWNPPSPNVYILNEPFTNFTANTWTTSALWTCEAANGGTAIGNPANAASWPTSWSASAEALNYSRALTSKAFTPVSSPALGLSYDIYLEGYEYAGTEFMTVALAGPSGVFKDITTYDDSQDIAPVKTVTYSLAAYKDSASIRVRFTAHGADSWALDFWWIDNVKIFYTKPDPKLCILGYNVYLNGVLDGTTPDTSYHIPITHVVYGTTNTACVNAIYGAGYSPQSCATFTAAFLCPPSNLTGVAILNTAFLSWTKPGCYGPASQWIGYDDGTLYSSLGTAGPIMFTVADRYDVSQLAALNGGAVTRIKFWPSVAAGNGVIYDVRVWKGTNAATLLEDMQLNSVIPGQWNTITLTTPVTIDITQDLWFGYTVIWGASNGTIYPVGFDAAVSKTGYSNGYRTAATGAFTAWASGDWLLDAYIENVPNPPLVGYVLTRNGAPLTTITNPNILSYYDQGLPLGTYLYSLTAQYQQTAVPLTYAYSLPVTTSVTISYGRPLPFYEPWSSGDFAYNDWVMSSPAPNWTVTSADGNPAPAANFSATPVTTGYTQSIETPALSALSYSCADIYLDFDYKLVDRNKTSAEFLTVEEWVNGAYVTIAEYSNHGNVNWTSKHFKLANTKGKVFTVRFRAHGVSSTDIYNWYVDNINIYAVCTPATALTYTESHNTVNLAWTAPKCVAGPDAQWIRWDDGVNYDAIGMNAAAIWDIAASWTPSQLAKLAGGSVTKISFYPSSAGDAAYNLRVWKGSAASATLLVDQPIPASSVVLDAWNTVSLTTPSKIDVTQNLFIGLYVNATGGYPSGCDAGPAHDGYGNWIDQEDGNGFVTLYSLAPTLNYDWNLAAYVESVKGESTPVILTKNPPAHNQPYLHMAASGLMNHSGIHAIHLEGLDAPEGASIVKGYNVYRTDSTGKVPYKKLNTALVSTNAYTDVLSLKGLGTYKYYVTAVFNDSASNTFLCETPGTDTVTVQFPHVGIVEIGSGQILVYPNPATENVNVKSDFTISSIEVMNYTGQTVYRNTTVSGKSTQFNVSNLQAGIYFLRIATDQGTRTVKITVTH
jgi:hypothetical protein